MVIDVSNIDIPWDIILIHGILVVARVYNFEKTSSIVPLTNNGQQWIIHKSDKYFFCSVSLLCKFAIVNSVWDIIMNNQMYLMDDINEAGKS